MPNVFISYRHDDGYRWAQSIFEALRDHLSDTSVFLDQPDIAHASTDVEDITSVEKCDVFLIVVSSSWLNQRPILDDWTYHEIVAAINGGSRLLPVIVDDVNISTLQQYTQHELARLWEVPSVRVGANHGDDLGMGRLLRVVDENLYISDPEKPEKRFQEFDVNQLSHEVIRFAPKGLLPFDTTDATSFIHLCPGKTTREGLPESIQFWKSRIEPTERNSFRVGLIVGPSGSGKSSLVRAGILPQLPPSVTPIYVESADDALESHLLANVRDRLPGVSGAINLVDAFTELRAGTQGKVLVVLDQFELWLQHTTEPESTQLARALRQCDGSRLQCVLVVRDSVWVQMTRLMDTLGESVRLSSNFAAVDFFEPAHARHVLRIHGHTLGRLPPGDLPTDQDRFLTEVVGRLTRSGKVNPAELAMFVEATKFLPWKTESLEAFGDKELGTLGFLSYVFSQVLTSKTSHIHQSDLTRIVEALVSIHDQKVTTWHSKEMLLSTAGFHDRRSDFENLFSVLAKVQLLTVSADRSYDFSIPEPGNVGLFRLTHDYLVPALRSWLITQKRVSDGVLGFCTKWIKGLLDSWRLWWHDPGRPLAECVIESSVDDMAICRGNIHGMVFSFRTALPLLKTVGALKEGDRFRWRIRPDGRIRIRDLARHQIEFLSDTEDSKVDELYRKFENVTTEDLHRHLTEEVP